MEDSNTPLPPPDTWLSRTANSLARKENTPEDIAIVLEAAGEMKSVYLKVLLARCYELINESVESEDQAHPSDGFLDEVLAATK